MQAVFSLFFFACLHSFPCLLQVYFLRMVFLSHSRFFFGLRVFLSLSLTVFSFYAFMYVSLLLHLFLPSDPLTCIKSSLFLRLFSLSFLLLTCITGTSPCLFPLALYFHYMCLCVLCRVLLFPSSPLSSKFFFLFMKSIASHFSAFPVSSIFFVCFDLTRTLTHICSTTANNDSNTYLPTH